VQILPLIFDLNHLRLGITGTLIATATLSSLWLEASSRTTSPGFGLVWCHHLSIIRTIAMASLSSLWSDWSLLIKSAGVRRKTG
jgi:hypothetical protein